MQWSFGSKSEPLTEIFVKIAFFKEYVWFFFGVNIDAKVSRNNFLRSLDTLEMLEKR